MKTISMFLAATLCLAIQAFAQVKSGDNITITEAVDDDVYVAGGTITINAPVHGDLIVAGGTINVNDSVTQDILVAGGNIIIDGFVGDDIRSAGGTIKVSQDVAGDLIVTGGKISIDDGVIIGGDLLAGGGEVTVNGEVRGTIKNGSGTFTLNGKATNDVDCRGGNIIINGTIDGNSILAANTIELGSAARFNKDVRYWNENGSPDFQPFLHGGKATFDSSLEMDSGKWHYLGFASLLMVLWYLGTALVMIFLLQYLFGSTFRNAADTVKNASVKSLGLGFLFLVGVPVAIIIAVITLIGLPLAVLTLILYITVLLLGTIIVALLVAHWINNNYYQSSWTTGKIVLAAFGIFIFLKLASLTPIVGPLIMLLLACMSLGGILQNIKWRRDKAVAAS